ncbi:MAG: cysteine desulfurase [Candidatus Desulforudis sp.]|nr:cysteine desulfurase [Desulforudis sp.]
MSGTASKPIYLDHAATTPVLPEVAKAMQPYFSGIFGNPASAHSFGREARAAVENARREVAEFIGAHPDEIIFTSGGTEANNLAVKGLAYGNRKWGNHIVTSAVEHHSILEAVRLLGRQGFKVTLLPVDRYGRVDPLDVARSITPRTVLVSVMHANNEVGSVQPLADIAPITRRYGICFHVDAVQTTGHFKLEAQAMEADLMSLSAHKIYGPKGVGALYVRRGVRLQPLMNGGRQDVQRRAGTQNVAAIVGFARAIRILIEERQARRQHITRLTDLLFRGIVERLDGLWLNGHPVERLPGNLHLGFEGVEGAALARNLDLHGIAVSTGSACSSGQPEPSHVLTAMGLDRRRASSCARFSLGRANTHEEIVRVLEVLPREVNRLRVSAAARNGA